MGRKLVNKRSLRSADFGEKRPRRIVQIKQVDDAVGLSRQEEQELNKALYASLNETRRTKSLPSLTGLDGAEFSVQASSNGSSNSSSRSASVTEKPSTSKSESISLGKRRSLRGGPLPKRLFRSDSTGSSEIDNLNIDESSQDSVRSSSSSVNGSKRKIHAQRKFAQGCSLPGTPTSSPAKISSAPMQLLSRTPKTEDFLTFLCLRGSSVLPPHLDFFNFSKEELPLRDASPKTSSSSGRGKQIWEANPDENSSTSSGVNEEIATATVATPTPSSSAGKRSGSHSKRSAARASAGTFETARGIVSLRQGLQRKVSSSSSSSSSSPRMCHHHHHSSSSPSCLKPASCRRRTAIAAAAVAATNSSPSSSCSPFKMHKPKYYFSPAKSLPSHGSGVLPGEFTPPSKMCRTMGKHSPLIYRPSPSQPVSPSSSPARSPVGRSPSSFSPLAPRGVPTGASKRKRCCSSFSSSSPSPFFASDTNSCQVTCCFPHSTTISNSIITSPSLRRHPSLSGKNKKTPAGLVQRSSDYSYYSYPNRKPLTTGGSVLLSPNPFVLLNHCPSSSSTTISPSSPSSSSLSCGASLTSSYFLPPPSSTSSSSSSPSPPPSSFCYCRHVPSQSSTNTSSEEEEDTAAYDKACRQDNSNVDSHSRFHYSTYCQDSSPSPTPSPKESNECFPLEVSRSLQLEEDESKICLHHCSPRRQFHLRPSSSHLQNRSHSSSVCDCKVKRSIPFTEFDYVVCGEPSYNPSLHQAEDANSSAFVSLCRSDIPQIQANSNNSAVHGCSAATLSSSRFTRLQPDVITDIANSNPNQSVPSSVSSSSHSLVLHDPVCDGSNSSNNTNDCLLHVDNASFSNPALLHACNNNNAALYNHPHFTNSNNNMTQTDSNFRSSSSSYISLPSVPCKSFDCHYDNHDNHRKPNCFLVSETEMGKRWRNRNTTSRTSTFSIGTSREMLVDGRKYSDLMMTSRGSSGMSVLSVDVEQEAEPSRTSFTLLSPVPVNFNCNNCIKHCRRMKRDLKKPTRTSRGKRLRHNRHRNGNFPLPCRCGEGRLPKLRIKITRGVVSSPVVKKIKVKEAENEEEEEEEDCVVMRQCDFKLEQQELEQEQQDCCTEQCSFLPSSCQNQVGLAHNNEVLSSTIAESEVNWKIPSVSRYYFQTNNAVNMNSPEEGDEEEEKRPPVMNDHTTKRCVDLDAISRYRQSQCTSIFDVSRRRLAALTDSDDRLVLSKESACKLNNCEKPTNYSSPPGNACQMRETVSEHREAFEVETIEDKDEQHERESETLCNDVVKVELLDDSDNDDFQAKDSSYNEYSLFQKTAPGFCQIKMQQQDTTTTRVESEVVRLPTQHGLYQPSPESERNLSSLSEGHRGRTNLNNVKPESMADIIIEMAARDDDLLDDIIEIISNDEEGLDKPAAATGRKELFGVENRSSSSSHSISRCGNFTTNTNTKPGTTGRVLNVSESETRMNRYRPNNSLRPVGQYLDDANESESTVVTTSDTCEKTQPEETDGCIQIDIEESEESDCDDNNVALDLSLPKHPGHTGNNSGVLINSSSASNNMSMSYSNTTVSSYHSHSNISENPASLRREMDSFHNFISSSGADEEDTLDYNSASSFSSEKGNADIHRGREEPNACQENAAITIISGRGRGDLDQKRSTSGSNDYSMIYNGSVLSIGNIDDDNDEENDLVSVKKTGNDLLSEKKIVLHSYGSLFTGQGFAFVDGKPEECKILNRTQYCAVAEMKGKKQEEEEDEAEESTRNRKEIVPTNTDEGEGCNNSSAQDISMIKNPLTLITKPVSTRSMMSTITCSCCHRSQPSRNRNSLAMEHESESSLFKRSQNNELNEVSSLKFKSEHPVMSPEIKLELEDDVKNNLQESTSTKSFDIDTTSTTTKLWNPNHYTFIVEKEEEGLNKGLVEIENYSHEESFTLSLSQSNMNTSLVNKTDDEQPSSSNSGLNVVVVGSAGGRDRGKMSTKEELSLRLDLELERTLGSLKKEEEQPACFSLEEVNDKEDTTASVEVEEINGGSSSDEILMRSLGSVEDDDNAIISLSNHALEGGPPSCSDKDVLDAVMAELKVQIAELISEMREAKVDLDLR